MGVRILALDIETAPAKVYTWGLYEQNIGTNQIVDDGYVLCWCAKWLGEKKIMSDALPNYTLYTKSPRNDREIAKSIWKVLDQAHIVVTHNGNKFDLKWLNTIFVKHGLPPATNYKSVDTYSEVKRRFHFISNKLDFICKKLGLGQKIRTGGFELWEDVLAGKKSAWSKMVTYCKRDVQILENLYLVLRPHMYAHPNIAVYEDGEVVKCPACGSLRYKNHGRVHLKKGIYMRLICRDCRKAFYDPSNIIVKRTVPTISC